MIYVVKSGDTIDQISLLYDIPAGRIAFDNQIPYPYSLAVGQALFINIEDTNIDKRFIFVNGYAYPFIQNEILYQTLPYLTDLSIFSYGFSTSGELNPPVLEDQWMIDAANQYGVTPILTLTPLDESGKFNNNLISAVVNNEEARSRLIEQIQSTLYQKGFKGVDIDFEYILAQDRDKFTDFVRVMTQTLNEDGFVVSVALAPKTSSAQEGLLYSGKDYGGLGSVANSVLLMTYEWGYTYGPPMAVAPINKVREVVAYAVTEIPNEKINMGIPNYGYNWPLPYVKGNTKAQTIGYVEAIQLAIRYGAEIKFDEYAKSPYFNYTENEIIHEVWFEDVRSMTAKFELVNEYELRGVGYWQLMRFFRANWLLLKSFFD